MRPLKLTLFGTLALATALAGGCSKSTATGGDFPDDPPITTPDEPKPNNPQPNNPNAPNPQTAKYAGIYSADAPVDFTQPGVLPGLASPALAALSNIGSDPGKALVDFAQATGAIDLPSAVRSVIGSVITQQLDSVLSPGVQEALDLISNITKITKTTVIKNKITVHTPRADKTVDVELEVTGASFDFVDFNLNPQHVDVTVPAASAAAAKTSLVATLTPRANAPVADADLTLSGGTVSIPMGHFIVQAMGPLVFQPVWGVNTLQEALTEIMREPCADLGVIVRNGVYNILGLDIGTSAGTTICNTAVTLAAAEIIEEITDIKVDGVSITNGRVVLYDISTLKPTMDKQSDRLAEGTWTWSFGSADVPSTLAGDRIGNAI